MIKIFFEEFVMFLYLKVMILKGFCELLEMEIMVIVDSSFDKDLINVFSVLLEFCELFLFVEEIVREDMVVLIDVVEEYLDQFVLEVIVLYLIDVYWFLKNIVKNKLVDFMIFLYCLKNFYDSLQGKQGMVVKIDECSCNVYSLRVFYMNVVNCGEMIKEIISNVLKRGYYQFG